MELSAELCEICDLNNRGDARFSETVSRLQVNNSLGARCTENQGDGVLCRCALLNLSRCLSVSASCAHLSKNDTSAPCDIVTLNNSNRAPLWPFKNVHNREVPRNIVENVEKGILAGSIGPKRSKAFPLLNRQIHPCPSRKVSALLGSAFLAYLTANQTSFCTTTTALLLASLLTATLTA